MTTSSPIGAAGGDRLTADTRRVTASLVSVVGLTLLVPTGLTFVMPPMARSLRLDDATVELSFALPGIAALLLMFLAGHLGDRAGGRRVILVAGGGFTLGSLIVATATGATAVAVGLALCGGTAVVIQVVALGLLQKVVPTGRAHTSVFTTFGAVFPLAFLVFPIATAGALEVVGWRWVPGVWTLGGTAIVGIGWSGLSRAEARSPVGEWLSLLLAGVTLAALGRVGEEIGRAETGSPRMAVTVVVGVASAAACAIRMRRARPAGFTFAPIRDFALQGLLGGVGVATLVALLTYVTIALEYLYRWSLLEVAVALVPAQLGAVVGAKVVGSRAIVRWGAGRAGRTLMLLLGPTALPLVLLQPDSPPWFLIGVATVCSGIGMATLTVLNADVMTHAPPDATGPVAAFRGAASALGSVLGVVVLGTGVIDAVRIDATGRVSAGALGALAAALRLDGVLAAAGALLGWALLVAVGRRADRRRWAGPTP